MLHKKILFVILVLGLTTDILFAKKYVLKLAQTWPKNLPIISWSVEQMAKTAHEMSNGRLIIKIDSVEKHKSPLGIFDMVRNGNYNMGHSAAYYYKGKRY